MVRVAETPKNRMQENYPWIVIGTHGKKRIVGQSHSQTITKKADGFIRGS